MFDILLIIVAAICLLAICFLLYVVKKHDYCSDEVIEELQAEISYHKDENRKLTAKNQSLGLQVGKLNKELLECKRGTCPVEMENKK